MKKIVANQPLSQTEYWDLVTSTLSSYEVKEISSDGKVTKRLVNDDYFLVNNIWALDYIGRIPNFEVQYKKNKYTKLSLKFQIENHSLSLELKFLLYNKLFKDELMLSSIFKSYGPRLNRLIEFLDNKHPSLHSLLDLDIEKVEKEWIWWLNNNGLKTIRKDNNLKYGELEHKSHIVNFLRSMHEQLSNLTDTREEWEKDKWDIRVLNEKYGIPYNESTTNYIINFANVKNYVFRDNLKKCFKQRLLRGKNFSWNTALNCFKLGIWGFLNFISNNEPTWNDLHGLTRKHIESYLNHLHNYFKNNVKHKKNANEKQFVLRNLSSISTFLGYLQRYDYSIAPKEPILKLIYSEDYPKLDKKSDDNIDYIPDFVLEQLFVHINDLHPDVQPIVWVAYKTGLRISDVLGLIQDCLIRLNGKYSIQTDIEKTYVKGHTIPIGDKLADLLAVLIHNSIDFSNDDNNPKKYIFVRYSGSRKGKPYSSVWVQQKLNELAIKKNITDEMGNIFHFKNHQFRHTYAVKMLNGGADIITVQQLLAHASPEMTLRYARLLDDTKRKAFEKVEKTGIFSFELNGEIHQVAESEEIPEDILDMMWKDEKLNAFDNPYGTCRARVNGNCPLASEPPCLSANDGKPCFDLAVGMTSFDIKKYELLIETTTKWIEASKEYGREDMVKANEKNLERYQSIYETIRNGNVIFGRIDRMKRQLENKKRKGVGKHV